MNLCVSLKEMCGPWRSARLEVPGTSEVPDTWIKPGARPEVPGTWIKPGARPEVPGTWIKPGARPEVPGTWIIEIIRLWVPGTWKAVAAGRQPPAGGENSKPETMRPSGS